MSEMSQHTPGPWEVAYINADCDEKEWFVAGTDGNPVAKIRPVFRLDDSENYQEMMANAHLIAAAPDLLDALMTMLQYLEREFTAGPVVHPYLLQVRAAIAKARGTA